MRQIGIGLIMFAQDNDDRLPWQLTPSGQVEHFGKNFALDPGSIFASRGVKREIVTPKKFFGPPAMPNAKPPLNTQLRNGILTKPGKVAHAQ